MKDKIFLSWQEFDLAVDSLAKQLKTEEAKAKFIWWFIRESKPKPPPPLR